MPEKDWTTGPAKWFAVGVLSTLAMLALGWSAWRTWGAPAAVLVGTSATPSTTFIHPAEVGRSIDQPNAAPKALSPSGLTEPATTPPAGTPPTGRAAAGLSPSRATIDRLINVNTADKPELETLPGIGPAMADRIIEERSLRGPFVRADDLTRVRGIGPKTLARLKPHITVEHPQPTAVAPPSDARGSAPATLP